MKIINKILTLALIFVFINCSNDSNPSNPLDDSGNSNQKYSVSGKVTDQDGDPVPNIQITAKKLSEQNPSVTASTDMQGNYSIELEGGYAYEIRVNSSEFAPNTKIISNLSSNQINVNFNVTVAKQRKVSGKIVNIAGNPIQGASVVLTLNVGVEIKTITTTSNSSGNYEITNTYGSEEYSTWNIKVDYNGFRFKSDNYSFLPFDEDLVINFEELADYYNVWQTSNGGSVADSTFSRVASSILTISQTDDRLLWAFYDSQGNVIYLPNTKDFVFENINQPGIHKVRITFSDTSVLNYEGIYEIDKSDSKWKLKLEVVNTEEGKTPPTVSAGFGSSQGGIEGMAYVWEFIQR